MNAPKVSPLAVQNLPLLHALNGLGPSGPSEVAAALGRDKDNTRKSLLKLREEGLVGNDNALTDAGRALTGILSAEGVVTAGPSDVVYIQHGDLEPDPENERHDFDDPASAAWEALEAFSVDIVQRDLISPLLVSPPAEPGGKYRIIAGERRWRAVGLAIERDDWSGERFGHGGGTGGLRCIVRPGLDARARAFLRLAENLQRSDLHPLDEGEAYAKLTRLPFGMSPAEIGEEIGKSDRHVANRIAVYERLDDAAKARMRLPRDADDYLTWRGALAIIQNHKPRPAFDLAPNEALVVLELAAYAAEKPSRNLFFAASDGWTQTPKPPAGDAFNALMRRDLIVSAEHDGGNAEPDWFARLNRTGDLQGWLNLKYVEGGGFESQSFEGAIWSARCDALGAMAATMLRDSGRWATPWLNAEVPPSPPGEGQAARSDARVGNPDATAAPPSPTPALRATPPHEGEGTEAVSPPPGEESRHPSPTTAPLERQPAPEASLSPSDPPETLPEFPTLAMELWDIMVDIAHKVASPEGVERPGVGRCAPVFEYWRFPRSQTLVQARLIGFAQAGATWFVYLTSLGHAWAGANIPPADLGRPGPYETAWLNPPEPEATKPAAPAIPGPLAPMLTDSFAQQMKEAAAMQADGELAWSAAIRECIALRIDGDRLGITVTNRIAETEATVWLDRAEVHQLWAELGFAQARMDGDA